MATHNDPDHHDVFPGGKAGVEVKPTKSGFAVARKTITRTDEYGNVTVWKLLTAPERVPSFTSAEVLYEADAIVTVNGKLEGKVTFYMPAALAVAWQMAQ
jgi:hypothetical protein